ncbi:MAG TPA: type I restriction-modification system subunit M N-terminal domain-containing protein [Sphingobium sp.]|uniref:type I restriction-modification system subunit M N-terminal domain-containing protein n=1 Tax=Sphingobium sp. TaxID=1912891 RepID=UPI002ECFDBD7
MNHQALASFIWTVADLLRGDYRQSEYGRVILPFTVLRRLDCVLEPTKTAVLSEYAAKTAMGINPEPFLMRAAKLNFVNTDPLDLGKLVGDQDNIRANLIRYVEGFSPSVRDIFEQFDFHTHIDRLAKNGLLYQVTERFARIDLHPDNVDNAAMGLAFEELIRKFAEISNETAGEHFTPREVIRLMVNLLFVEDDDALTKPGIVRTIYDPTAGTGGMLIKGQAIENIAPGNTLSDDGHSGRTFDYISAAVTRFMRRVGICEERGSGIDKVVSETEAHQLPPPLWEQQDAAFRVPLRSRTRFGSVTPSSSAVS